MTRSGASRLTIAAAVVLVWVGAPVAVVAALTRDVAEVRLVADEPAWVSVRALSGEVEQRLGLALTWQRGPTAVAPAWDGVVEVVHVVPGGPLRSGDEVAVVGGVSRVAHAGERPVTRELRQGDRGPDVAVLHGLLAEHGLAHGDGDRFTTVTARGVRGLAERLGAGRVEVFDPSWVLHLSASDLTVAEVDLTVGAPVPEAGATVVEGVATLGGAGVTTQDWAARAATTARETATVGGSGTRPGSSPAPEVGDEARSVPDGAELRVGGQPLPLTAERDRVDEAGLAELEALVDRGAVAVDAVAVQPPLADGWAVPSVAVRTGADGLTTVRRERDGVRTDVAVEVVGSDGPSSTSVTGDLAATDLLEVPSSATAPATAAATAAGAAVPSASDVVDRRSDQAPA